MIKIVKIQRNKNGIICVEAQIRVKDNLVVYYLKERVKESELNHQLLVAA